MARPGMDSPFDEGQMKVGRRLAMKVLNASRFVLLACGSDVGGDITNSADLAMLAGVRATVAAATSAFDEFDYATALESVERNFWSFCDDYVELVKERAYGGQDAAGSASARAALLTALDVQLRLLAPFLPFVTEEVWSWFRTGSIHRAAWPTTDEVPGAGDVALLADLATALGELRGAKSVAKVSMKTPIDAVEFTGPAAVLERLGAIEADLRAVGRIVGAVQWTPGDADLAARITLAPTE
jgi:valyl-tRNA synthetase